MREFQYLTINGTTYTVADPDAAVIRDDTVGGDAWSARNIVDRLCPAFSQSGSPVTCQPVEGYPLEVVLLLQPQQAGSGDPGPDNIRPITGHTGGVLTLGNGSQTQTFSAQFGQTVYGGSYRWDTGLLTLDKTCVTFDGTENWDLFGGGFFILKGLPDAGAQATLSAASACCSHYPYIYGAGGNVTGWFQDASYTVATPRFVNTGYTTVEEWVAYVTAQYEAGTPLQFCYPLKAPVTCQLEPQAVLALAGSNSLQCGTSQLSVSGRSDPRALFEKLTEL